MPSVRVAHGGAGRRSDGRHDSPRPAALRPSRDLGQGVRAIVGLKNAGSLNSTTPSEQAEFSLAYLVLSLMIGFIAGVLAGIALNLENIITVDPGNWKLLLGIAGSGYIGADFIENTMSVVIPGAKISAARPAPPPAPPPRRPRSLRRLRRRAAARRR